MSEQVPFRIYRVDEKEPVPVFSYVTTVVATNRIHALNLYSMMHVPREPTGEELVAQSWRDHGPPRIE